MAISEDDVRHVADLARLGLSDEEVKTMTRQLGAVLEHMGTLDELDTSETEPLIHVRPESQRLRPDQDGEDCLPREEALQLAPDTQGEYYRVPAVMDGGDSE